MDIKKIVTIEFRKIDLLRDEISKLQNKINESHLKISNYKKTFEKENSHFIGKKAVGSMDVDNNSQNIELTCSKIIITDDFNIKPLFVNKKNKKISVDFYHWL